MDKAGAGFSYTLNRQKLRQIRRREGRYLLRTSFIPSFRNGDGRDEHAGL
jgi:hypothetical protein